MTVTESKLRQGTLKFGTVGGTLTSYGCQPSNVTIASSYSEDGDPVEVLCGDNLPAATTVAKSLKITSIQDFDNAAGLMRFLRDHELQECAFQWQPNPQAEIASGTVQVRQGDWGGDVGKRITTAPELPIISLSWLPAPPAATGATAGSPGTWTPTGAAVPYNLAALRDSDVVVSPAAAWATGEHMLLGDASKAYWNATAWTAGTAP